jgi:hypothetical protein
MPQACNRCCLQVLLPLPLQLLSLLGKEVARLFIISVSLAGR